jgi:hypothetical protein
MSVLRGADWRIARRGQDLAHLWLVTRWAAPRRHGGPVAWKQMAPQVLEKARFAEENGSRREVDIDVRIFFCCRKMRLSA